MKLLTVLTGSPVCLFLKYSSLGRKIYDMLLIWAGSYGHIIAMGKTIDCCS